MPSTKCGFPYENIIYVTKKTEKKKAKNYIIAWKTMQIAGKTAVACIHFGTGTLRAMCNLLELEPFICIGINMVLSGTGQEMRDIQAMQLI
jgi:hypothetical protein